MRKFTIVDIVDWEKDEWAMCGDEGHISKSEILELLAEETRTKIEDNEWPGLPFTCEAANKDHALEKYKRKFCEYDYIQPTEAEFEEEEEEAEEEDDGTTDD